MHQSKRLSIHVPPASSQCTVLLQCVDKKVWVQGYNKGCGSVTSDRRTQTGRQTDGTDSITSTVDVGGKKKKGHRKRKGKGPYSQEKLTLSPTFSNGHSTIRNLLSY